MHQHILIPVALDHEKMIPRKIEMARHLLAEGGRITLYTVLENVPGFVAEFVDMKPENHLRAQITKKLEESHDGGSDITCVVETGKAGVKIAQYAEAHAVDLIIVASHSPGLQEYFLGSTASRVARRAPCSVYIMR
ncbi:Nucleotide-binding universal stress protein, UspA family [Roseivivax lentus]|uniref:Nucleotide-binding universal stress protein, UspA family n=1 Tax=Roseivivax lentus TaxID=633194 RepID=A0A1N7L1I1_9RHOB|nr:universal stress protein [Roseivivax lentus]SIS67674.1 Nucleotide-binding universal stress protein, UspA family [Roseivivax lentus]